VSSEGSQIVVPPAFVALFVPEGRTRPVLPWAAVAARHELCEDLAQSLAEQAPLRLHALGVAESDVLERFARGLAMPGGELAPREAWWVLQRVAEILGWPAPVASLPELSPELQRPA
jgi:hypothetical protein